MRKRQCAEAGCLAWKPNFSQDMCSRHTGQHILAKQLLVDVGGDPFTFSADLAIAAATHFGWDCLLPWFLASFLTVFKSFIPFSNFFTSQKPLQRTQAVSQKSEAAKLCGGVPPPLGICPTPLPLQLLQEIFRIWLYVPKMDPHLLCKQTGPPFINWATAGFPGSSYQIYSVFPDGSYRKYIFSIPWQQLPDIIPWQQLQDKFSIPWQELQDIFCIPWQQLPYKFCIPWLQLQDKFSISWK